MRAGLDRAQAHTSSMFGVVINTRSRITGTWGPRQDNASITAVISAVLLERVLAREKAR